MLCVKASKLTSRRIVAVAEGEYECKTPAAPTWLERSGLDLDDLTLDAAEERADEERQSRIKANALVVCSRSYLHDAITILQPLLEAEPVLADAHDLYSWALTIGAKTHRAVSSAELNKEERFDADPIQNDANGSAKVVRLCVQHSLPAWDRVSGSAVEPGLVGHLTEGLRAIDAEIEAMFPLAMGFVRPGFDEEIPGIVRPWSITGGEGDEDEEEEEEDED